MAVVVRSEKITSVGITAAWTVEELCCHEVMEKVGMMVFAGRLKSRRRLLEALRPSLVTMDI
jgi:hypothetical protein